MEYYGRWAQLILEQLEQYNMRVNNYPQKGHGKMWVPDIVGHLLIRPLITFYVSGKMNFCSLN